MLIPIQCEYYALEGLGQLLSNIELIKSHLNGGLQISTILLTMYDGRTKLADQVAQEVRSHFGDLVLDVVIPRSVRVSEAPGYGQSVMTYDPGSRGALTYFEAAREIAERGTRMEPVGAREPASAQVPAVAGAGESQSRRLAGGRVTRRGGLGKGLGALIPTAPVAPAAERPGVVVAAAVRGAGDRRGRHRPRCPAQAIREVPVDEIRPNAKQPRQVFDEDAQEELKTSIKEFGLLQPVVVRATGPGSYELVMGERRWRAGRDLGLPTIPAIVRDTADDAMLRDALLENLHRVQLNPLEEAAAYRQLLEEFGTTHEELANGSAAAGPR